MSQYCGNCRHRAGGCSFSPDPENPILENLDQPCVFIKTEGRSRWEPKIDFHGRLVVPLLTDPRPRDGRIMSPTPDHSNPLSLVVSKNEEDGIWQQFLTDGSRCFHVETKEYIGELSDFQPKPPDPKEVDRVIKEFREKYNIK